MMDRSAGDMSSYKKPTSNDVAKLAGVSQSTVSMILNNKKDVSFSDTTREKVISAAKELKYRILHTQDQEEDKERVIAIICPNLTNPYYTMLIQSIEGAANKEGYNVFICNTFREYNVEKSYLELLSKIKVAGIIYIWLPIFPELVEGIIEDTPLVVIGDKNGELEVDAIQLNSVKSGMIVAEHLIGLGHEKIAFISTPLVKEQVARNKRLEGIKMKFREHGLPESNILVRTSEQKINDESSYMHDEYTTGYNQTKFVIQENDITAIVALNDMVAIGVIDALIDNKLKIPRDYSVCGCDNTLISSLRGISLTTVEHFIMLKGKDAFQILRRKIEDKNSSPNNIVPTSIFRVEYEPKLIVRDSSGANNKNRKR